MHDAIEKLLSISSDSLSSQAAVTDQIATHLVPWGDLGRELAEVLTLRNGFYAFESALLIRAFDSMQRPHGILQWNEPSLWRSEYRDDLSHALFFGEDVFG